MYHTPDETRSALGPASLLWRWAGDSRIAFLGGSIGILQLMHPAIGAGVLEHSDFFDDPYDRVFRSLPKILGAVYDADAATTGTIVRDYHRTIKGVDAQGRRYHALDPETYWWAHATFQYMTEQVVDRFDRHRLTAVEREQLYQEGILWYRRYGVSERAVPPDRESFEREWDRVCTEVLEMNPAVEFVLETLRRPGVPRLQGPLAAAVPLLRLRPLRRLAFVPVRITAIGGLPPIVRERFGIRWTRADQRQLDLLEAAVRRAWPLVPWSLRWQPRALAGWKRARAEERSARWLAAS